jgi:hypothetical protein
MMAVLVGSDIYKQALHVRKAGRRILARFRRRHGGIAATAAASAPLAALAATATAAVVATAGDGGRTPAGANRIPIKRQPGAGRGRPRAPVRPPDACPSSLDCNV